MSEAGKGDTYRPINREIYNRNFAEINWHRTGARFKCGCTITCSNGVKDQKCPWHGQPIE